jgi:hypothetical protein
MLLFRTLGLAWVRLALLCSHPLAGEAGRVVRLVSRIKSVIVVPVVAA